MSNSKSRQYFLPSENILIMEDLVVLEAPSMEVFAKKQCNVHKTIYCWACFESMIENQFID